MANVEPIERVIDFDALMEPIPGDNPSGQPMHYSETLLYDKIREARTADDASLSQGQWQTDLKVADYRQVINLASNALATQTKDLQIAVWFCEALTAQHGFAGFRDGILLIRRLEEEFWDTLYPEIDDGDMEGRANSIDWMNSQVSIMLKKVPMTGGEGLNFLQWEESVKYDFPEDIESLEYEQRERYQNLKIQAETENRKTGEHWKKASAASRRDFCETLNLTLEECFEELNELDRINEEKFDRNQVPAVNELKNTLTKIAATFEKVLAGARQREPWEAPDDGTGGGDSGNYDIDDGGEVVVRTGQAVATGAIQSRQDALKRLDDVAAYFRKNEPHSPISYLVQRAVKWGNMPLEVWLQDVIQDESVISQIRQTLGFNTDSESSGSSGYSESSESSDW